MKKIGDGCGSFIELDEESFFAPVLNWVKILVRVDGRRLPQSIKMEEGSSKFSIQLWWEIPPHVGKLNGVRVPMKYAEIEVKDELCDVPSATKRVIRGDKQRYKDVAKNFKAVSFFRECNYRRSTKRPINYADGSSDPDPFTKVGYGSNGPVQVDGLT